MFDDLIKEKIKWEVYIGCNPIKVSEKGFKIWGQKTLKLNKNKPVIVWDIKKHKSGNSEPWYAPAGFKKENIVESSNGRKAAR